MNLLSQEYPEKGLIPKLIKQSFLEIEKGLEKIAEDVRYSGSTCTSILIFGRKMYVANLGDSRILMVKKGTDHTKRLEEDFAFK